MRPGSVVQGPGELLIDGVSLFPAENIRNGSSNPWPFRKDLLDKLKVLHPRCGHSQFYLCGLKSTPADQLSGLHSLQWSTLLQSCMPCS